MDRFEDMNTLVRVVESGSITKAAQRLRVVKSAVSRRIADLENRLGVRLLNRTTAAVSLTEAGTAYYERALRILAEVDETEHLVANVGAGLKGSIRIAAPVTFTVRRLQPVLNAFMIDHPDVVLEVDLTDRTIDIVEEGFDLAIRVAPSAKSGLSARRLAPILRVACASPRYLSQRGVPRAPSDLAAHEGLRSTNSPESKYWRFRAPDGSTVVAQPRDRVRANNGDVIVAAAVAGLGICAVPLFSSYDSIREGALVPILTDHALREDAVFAVYPPNRHLSRRVRLLIDHLAARMPEAGGWQALPRTK